MLAALGLCAWGPAARAQGLPVPPMLAVPLSPLDAVADQIPPEHLGPPELQVPLFGASAVDDAFPAFVDTLFDTVGRSLDAAVADEVLASIGRFSSAHMATLTARAKARDIDPFHAKAPPSLPGDAPDQTFDSLTNHSFGDNRLLAVGVSQKLRGFSSLNTDVNLRHTTGPLDVQVKVSGNQGLNMAQSMSVTYDSTALLGLNQNLELGMNARGSLGTLGALTPAQDQVAGPFARIKLFGNGTNVSAETGYSFRMRQENDPNLNRFHAKLNLNVKL
jgi:hypothetical protein